MLLYIQVKRNKTKKGGIMNSYYSDTNTIKVQEMDNNRFEIISTKNGSGNDTQLSTHETIEDAQSEIKRYFEIELQRFIDNYEGTEEEAIEERSAPYIIG